MSCFHDLWQTPRKIGTASEGPMHREMELQLKGYGLTTAEILYRLPDHPVILQTYLWQDYDLAPNFPEMHGFLKFWQETLDGPLHSVRYVHRKLISATDWRALKGEFILN
jgi:uncharacterized protein Usg